MTKKVRFGILGAARIASRQIEAMLEASNTDPIAIASRSLQKAEQIGNKFGIAPIKGYTTLLKHSDIDAVYIPLPNHLHCEWAIEAMRYGKHVLVDKPLAISLDQVKTLAHKSKKKQLLVMEGVMYRFHPVFDKIAELIEQGTIGTVMHIQFEFCHNISGYLEQSDNYRYYSKLGGGALFDLGCYGIDLFNFLLKLLGSGRTSPALKLVHSYQQMFDLDQLDWTNSENEPADESTHALFIDQQTGITAQLITSFGYHRKELWISGTEGIISVKDITSPSSKSINVDKTIGKSMEIQLPQINTYKLQYQEFSKAILEDLSAPISIQESLTTMELIEEIRGD